MKKLAQEQEEQIQELHTQLLQTENQQSMI